MRDFSDTSALDEEIVTRMMALDDFAQGRRKARNVLDKIRSLRETTVALIEPKRIAIERARDELNKLPADQSAPEPLPSLLSQAQKLHATLRSFTDLDEIESHVTTDIVRDWRSRLSAAREELRRTIEQLRKTGEEAVQVHTTRAALEESAMAITKHEAQAAQLETAVNKLDGEIDALNESERRLNQQLEEAKSLQAKIRDAQRLSGDLAAAEKLVADHEKRMTTLRNERAAIDTQAAQLQKDLATHRDAVSTLEDNESMARERLGQLNSLIEGMDKWRQNRQAQLALSERVEKLETMRAKQIHDRDEVKKQCDQLERHFVLIKERYKRIAQSADEMTAFLETAEKLASGPTCPACGHDHQSRDELVNRIHARENQRSEEEKACAGEKISVERQLETLRSNISKFQSESDSVDRQISEQRTEVDALKAAIQAHERLATALEFDVSQASAAELIRQRFDTLRKNADGLSRELLEAKQLAGEADRKSDVLETSAEENQKNLQLAESKLRQSRGNRDKIRNELSELGTIADSVQRDDAPDVLQVERKIKELGTKLADKIRDRQKALASVKEHRRKLKDVQATIEELKQRCTNAQNRIRDFEDRVAELGIARSASVDVMESSRHKCEARLESMDDMLRQVRFLETALDSAALSARRDALHHEQKTLAGELNQLETEVARLVNLTRFFEQVERVLADESGRTVNSHIDSYGPLATVLQHRLRAVYGFEDIRLTAEGRAIQVRVVRREKRLKPAEFFSDSQVQILMLSLFLAGRLTQTWSSFAPTLLDDPVTHFDDLNSFAFAELIRGIVERNPGRNQFIISTCEERLLQIFKSKLSKISGGLRVYRFLSIGTDGPVVEQLS